MPKFCTKCGHEILNPITDQFCMNCGVSIRKCSVGINNESDAPPKFKHCDCHACNPTGSPRQARAQSVETRSSPTTPQTPRSRTISETSIAILKKAEIGTKKSGWLMKQSTDLVNPWKKRYFTMNIGILFYFTSQKDQKANGSIPLKTATIEILHEHSKSNCFRIVTSNSKVHVMYADSSEEMHDWIDLMIEHGAQMYDPKLHGWRPVQVEFPDTQEASPIDITRSRSEDRDIRRSNSSANLDPKKKRTSTLKSLFQKLTGGGNDEESTKKRDPLLTPQKSKSMSEVPCALNNKNDIGTPILISKPNPIIISDLKPTKGKVDEDQDPDVLRDLMFSPSPRTKVVKQGNTNICDTCNYKSDSFLRFCGQCGCKLMVPCPVTSTI